MKKPKPVRTARVTREALSGDALREAAAALEEAPSWVIFSHVKLDGDAIGSSTALFEAGAVMGKRVRWLGADAAPPNFFFLPHVKDYIVQKKYSFDSEDDLYIFLDSANEDRGIKGLRERSPKVAVLNIDHHEDNTMFGTINCVDGGASSTSEILWRMMTEAGWPITPLVAECLYTGLATDTGWFAFSNTSHIAHSMAADLLGKGVEPSKVDSCVRHNRSMEGVRLWGLALLRVFRWGDASQFAMTWLTRRDFSATGALPGDTAMLVNQMLMIQGVRFAVLLTEDDSSGQVKGNLRSKDGIVAAAAVARTLGGGGHPKAAGINLPLKLSDAIHTVQKAVDQAHAEWSSADR